MKCGHLLGFQDCPTPRLPGLVVAAFDRYIPNPVVCNVHKQVSLRRIGRDVVCTSNNHCENEEPNVLVVDDRVDWKLMLMFLVPLSQPTLMNRNLQGIHEVKYTKYTKDDVPEQNLQGVSSDSAPRVCFCGVISRYSSAPHLHERLVNAIRCANSRALVKLDRDREGYPKSGDYRKIASLKLPMLIVGRQRRASAHSC